MELCRFPCGVDLQPCSRLTFELLKPLGDGARKAVVNGDLVGTFAVISVWGGFGILAVFAVLACGLDSGVTLSDPPVAVVANVRRRPGGARRC